MRVSRQFVTSGALVLVAGVFLPMSSAQAYGQHWRPTAAAAPVQTTAYRRVVNVPSFRPRVSAASPRYRPSRPVAKQPAMRPIVAMRPPAHPRPDHRQVRYPVPRAWSSLPMWSNPFSQTAQVWYGAMPMYPGRFAGRPVAQPRMPQHARPQAPGQQPASPYAMTEYRPHESLSAVHGTGGRAPVWRQVHPAGSAPRFVPSRAVPVGYRPIPGAPAPAQQARVPQFAAVGMPRGHWRPGRAATAPSYAHSDRFRPATYGGTSRGRAPAQQGGVAQKLPGWVTTHQDTGNLIACDWCSGS